jgi:hypothetical protein
MEFDVFRSPDEVDDYLGPGLGDTELVFCPYCGESSELPVDLVGGDTQEFVQDCEVCCHPWLVRVRLDVDGCATVSVTTLDDE